VQDAAYDSLLKSRRQELHGKIARVIDARFPDIKATEPGDMIMVRYADDSVPRRHWRKRQC